MKSKISSIIKKKPDKSKEVPVNLKCDGRLYESLKRKLKKNNSDVHLFFTSVASAYVSEDEAV